MRYLICVVAVLLNLVPSARAQSPNATLNGQVVDSSGGAIAGASVDAVNVATNVKYSTKTNAEGMYLLPELPPANYEIQVSHSGFKTIVKPDVLLNVRDAVVINFTLPLGAVSERVTVEGGAPLVNTQSAEVSTVIDRNFVESLPLNGRSFNTLLQLTPGVVIAPTVNGFSGSGQFSIAGQRQDANNFTVDGVSANFGSGPGYAVGQVGTGNSQAFSALGGTSSLVSVEALQEFRIETSSFAPQFGRSPGGQIILNTRSGTNNFHGGIYEYFRNDVLDANNWFANQAGNPRASERHNDYGGFLGGPVWKNRTFFFLSYEGARLRLPQTSVIRVPSEYARMYATTNAPALVPYLNAYPQPDDKTITTGVYTSGFTGTYSNSASLNAGSVRIDHTFNSHFTIFGRYNDAPSDFTPRIMNLAVLNPETVDTKTLTIGVNMALSAKTVNTIRGNYSAQRAGLSTTLDSFGGSTPPPPSLLLGSLSATQNSGFLRTFDTGQVQTGLSGTNRTRQANLTDDVSITSGIHQLKFGGDYRAIFLDRNPFNYQVGFQSPTVKQLVTTGTAQFLTNFVRPGQLLAQSLSLYAQDNWRATTRLTLTYGVRWEFAPAPSARGNTTLTAWTNTNNPAQIALAQAGTPVWNTTYGNFAPRLGVAYSLSQDASFVLRAGVGIFYDLGTGEFADSLLSFPNQATASFMNVSVPPSDVTPYLPAPPSLQPPYPNGVFAYSPNLKLPRSYQWNVALEKSLRGKQAITATYVGQAGRDLTRQTAIYQPNSNFKGDFLLTNNSARSNYNALQIQYRRPLTNRLQALLNYTWSHSLDNVSNDMVVGLSDTSISGASNYALSDFDVRHSFSGAITYDIPAFAKSRALSLFIGNWSLDTVVVARSGFPFNTIIFTESPDPGFEAFPRPDRVMGQPLYLYGSQCVAMFGSCPGGKAVNPGAFSIQSTPRQGTEGRNDIPGFGLAQVDLSLKRKFPITERVNLQFRADAFNVINHPNFANPYGYLQYGSFGLASQSMLNQSLGGLNPLFQEGGPRSLQLSLRLSF